MPCLSVLCLRSQTLESHFARFLILALLLPICVIWSKIFNLYEPEVHNLLNFSRKRYIPLDYMKIGCIISLVFHLYPTILLK